VQTVVEKQTFGEYGPYRIDACGVPFLSDVVWDMLERQSMSAEEFGTRFGALTRRNKKPYTKSRVYQMLRDNSFPEEKSRRWVVAKLLHIPPFLLGVNSLQDLLEHETEQVHDPVVLPRKMPPRPFDLLEYQATLHAYWKKHRAHLNDAGETEIEERITLLEKAYIYGSKDTKRQIAMLLCGYHMLSSNIATDQRDFDEAISHLNKAYAVAKQRKLVKLEGACLLRRGWALKERGEASTMQGNIPAALEDFAFAARDFHLALSLTTKLSPSLHGSILLSLGKLAADQAKHPSDFHQAIIQIDKAEPFVGKKVDEEGIHFIQLDEERYYLDRAAAYLASASPLACYPRDARRELRSALAAAPTPIPQRRQAYNMILEAKSYVIEGQANTQRKRPTLADTCYATATQKASEALSLVREIHSTINLGRIEQIYEHVKETPYAKESVDLASLEVELMAAKRPYLFQ